jgi:hypothetical protein
MALVSLEDPGLTVFPTHRLISGLADDPERQEALGSGLKAVRDRGGPGRSARSAGAEGVGVFGYIDSQFKRAFRLRLNDTERVDRAPRAARAPTALSTPRSSRSWS